MFIKQENITSTYNVGDNMKVDIVDNGLNYEAWVYHSDYGIKTHMFGIAKNSKTPDGRKLCANDFIQIVLNNLDQYIETYKNEYID